MVMATPTARAGRRLSREDWAAAALRALAYAGVAAVAVEPIAQQLGTTKGSFYWHFASRDELLQAALGRWEREHTLEVNAAVDAESADPHERLRALVSRAVRMAERDPVGVTLLASADHPMVAPVLERVTRIRLEYLTRLFQELGLSAEAAQNHALLTYSAYLGHAQLAHSTPGVLPASTEARRQYLNLVLAALAPPPSAAAGGK